MKKTLIAIAAGILAFANLALADILPPGQTVVPVCASFSNTESMLDTMAVYGYETGVTGEKVDFSSFIDGECFKPGYKFNTYKVYGVKTEHALKIKAEIEAGTYDPSKDTEAYPTSIQPEMGDKYVATPSTLTEIKNIYKIIGFDEEKHVLTIEPLRTEQYDSALQAPTVIEGKATPVNGDIITDDNGGSGHNTGDTVFNDVDSSSPYFNALKMLKEGNVISGYPDGTFKPGNTINRAELAKIIVGAAFTPDDISGCMAFYVNQSSVKVDLFTDVSLDYNDKAGPPWYLDYVCVGKHNGFIKGYPDGSFKPAQDINFVEAAKIIVGGFGEIVMPGDPWYKAYVDELAGKNAIPTTITTFSQKITRGEMAEIIYRMKANVTTLPSQKYADLK